MKTHSEDGLTRALWTVIVTCLVLIVLAVAGVLR